MKKLFPLNFLVGWSSISWNTIAIGKVTPDNRPATVLNLENSLLSGCVQQLSLLPSYCGNPIDFKQYSRITITIDELSDAQLLTTSNELLRNFDLVSVCPGNGTVFAYLCKNADIDIISIDFSHRLSFNINKKLIDEAVTRGIMFEISYVPLLSTPTLRRETIANSAILIKYLRGRNIILTSGSDKTDQIRGPLDAIMLAKVLNISDENARKSIGENCDFVIKHSIARKSRYSQMEILSTDNFQERYPDISVSNNTINYQNENITVAETLPINRKKFKKRKRKQSEQEIID